MASQSQPLRYVYTVICSYWSFFTDFPQKRPKSEADYHSRSYKHGDKAYYFIQG